MTEVQKIVVEYLLGGLQPRLLRDMWQKDARELKSLLKHLQKVSQDSDMAIQRQWLGSGQVALNYAGGGRAEVTPAGSPLVTGGSRPVSRNELDEATLAIMRCIKNLEKLLNRTHV